MFNFFGILVLLEFDLIARFSHNLVLREFATIYFLFCTGYSLVFNIFLNIDYYFIRGNL